MTTRTGCTQTLLFSDYIFFFHQRNRVFEKKGKKKTCSVQCTAYALEHLAQILGKLFEFLKQISLNLEPNRIFFAENFIKFYRNCGESQIIAGTQFIFEQFLHVLKRNFEQILRQR